MNSVIKTPWKKVIRIKPHQDYKLLVIMEDDRELIIDLKTLINNKESFWRLKNFRYFRKVSIDPLGGLNWPEGEDISPTKIFDYQIKN